MVTKTKNKNWFNSHPWLTGIICLFIVFIAILSIVSTQISSEVEELNEVEDLKKVGEDIEKLAGTETEKEQQEIIIKSSDEMLPISSELPTEYSIGEKVNITKESIIITSRNAEEGFDSGKQLSISKYKIGVYTVTDYIEITFGIYKFVNSEYASSFKNTVMNAVKNEGGYTKLSVSADAECFSWKEDYGYSGGKLGDSICYNKNVVFWISVSMVNTLKQPDSYVKDMVKIINKKVN